MARSHPFVPLTGFAVRSTVWQRVVVHSALPMIRYSLAIWIVDAILITSLMLVLWQRSLWSRHPAFFAYCLFDVLRTWGLLVLRPPAAIHSYTTTYFYSYWISDAVLQVLLICAVQELFVSQLAPYRAVVRFGKVTFYAVSATALMIVFVSAAVDAGADGYPLVAAVLTLDRSLRVIQTVLLLFTVLFSLKFGLSWTGERIGLAIGLGILTISEMLVVTVRASLGQTANEFFRTLKPTMFACAVAFWLWTFLRKPVPITHMQPVPASQLASLNSKLRRALQ